MLEEIIGRHLIGRPSKPLLSRELIARTALALVDRHGPEGASIRRVAARLGVNPASLYNHVPNRAAMVEDLRALVSANIPGRMHSGRGPGPTDKRSSDTRVPCHCS